MKVISLEGENFLTLERFKIYLEGRGLHLIQGVNLVDSSARSNGSGKSSLVDAMSWCGYNMLRGVRGNDKIVNRVAKKNCWVSMVVTHGSTTYTISRHRKHKVHKNALRLVANLATGDVDMSKGTDAETQKEVERVLGASYEVFMAAVYCGQEQMPDLPGMTDKQLKTLIEEAAGLQRIEAAYQVARDRFNARKGELEVQRTNALRIQNERDRTDTRLADTGARHQAWEDDRAVRVAAAETAVTTVRTSMANAAKDALARKPAVVAGQAELAEIATKLAEHGTLAGAATAADRLVAQQDRLVERVALGTARDKVRAIEAQIANADEEMAKPCPECGKPHTAEERDDYIAHRQVALSAAQADLTAVTARVRAQVLELQRLQGEAATARAAVPDVTALVARQQVLQRERADYDSVVANLRKLQGDVANAQALVTQRQTEPNPDDSALKLLQDQRAQLETDLAEAVEKARAAEKLLKVAEAVVKVFGPAGVRAQILDNVTPFLNERTADYLSTLSDGNITATWSTLTKSASGDLREAFGIEVTHAQGGDDFTLISGGEKKKVRLATGLALQDLTASRASHPIDLWIGDEIDDAVDPAGLERLMTILERKARERGTVVVISHNDLKDWIDDTTTVTKYAQHLSKVEGSLCS